MKKKRTANQMKHYSMGYLGAVEDIKKGMELDDVKDFGERMLEKAKRAEAPWKYKNEKLQDC